MTILDSIKQRTAFLLRLGAAIERQAEIDKETRRKAITKAAVDRWQWNAKVRAAKERQQAEVTRNG